MEIYFIYRELLRETCRLTVMEASNSVLIAASDGEEINTTRDETSSGALRQGFVLFALVCRLTRSRLPNSTNCSLSTQVHVTADFNYDHPFDRR
jgi:hypothetical protein